MFDGIAAIVIVVFAVVVLVLQQIEVLSNQIARTLNSLHKVLEAAKSLRKGGKGQQDAKAGDSPLLLPGSAVPMVGPDSAQEGEASVVADLPSSPSAETAQTDDEGSTV
ncbi:hypothetical protein OG800_26475 [Streptomyces sp. NBC_00445]|uniref:hypothetical protein n=1 Tax=Streptomyces sp. NBC_00445 TaxID=2975745 RepID=UPI002E23A956